MTHPTPTYPRDEFHKDRTGDPTRQVRESDLEPHTGLRYLSTLFRAMAIILLLLIVAEVITGLVRVGSAAIPTLIMEASRMIVLAGLLWGAGDLAVLLIEIGHDVRAARILLGRVAASSRADGGRAADTRHATNVG